MKKAVLITGGAAGLGLAVAKRFRSTGASVTIFDRSAEALRSATDELGDDVCYVEGDVTSFDDNVRAVDATVRAFGGLDVLVGNAGIFDARTKLADIPGADLAAAFDELVGIDVKGYVLGAKAALTELRKRKGCIIFTASVASFHPSFGGALYTTAKHAVMGLTKRLAIELGPEIRVNAVGPGYIATNLGGVGALGQRRFKVMPEAPPLERFMLGFVPKPDDYAGIYPFLASEDARAITGITLLADSGSSLRT